MPPPGHRVSRHQQYGRGAQGQHKTVCWRRGQLAPGDKDSNGQCPGCRCRRPSLPDGPQSRAYVVAPTTQACGTAPGTRHRRQEVGSGDPTKVRVDGRVISSRDPVEVLVPAPTSSPIKAGTAGCVFGRWGSRSAAATPRNAHSRHRVPVGSAIPWSRIRRPPSLAVIRPLPSDVYDCNNYEPRLARSETAKRIGASPTRPVPRRAPWTTRPARASRSATRKQAEPGSHGVPDEENVPRSACGRWARTDAS